MSRTCDGYPRCLCTAETYGYFIINDHFNSHKYVRKLCKYHWGKYFESKRNVILLPKEEGKNLSEVELVMES